MEERSQEKGNTDETQGFFCFLTATALVIIWFVYRVEQKRARQEGQDSSLTSERDGSDEGRKNLKRFQL